MSSKLEQLIDEIEEYIDNCKPHLMNHNKIIVVKEEIDDLLRELRMKTPDEIKRYQQIISQREAILNEARERAEDLINKTAAQTTELINEQEIMRQAYERAEEIVELATKQAQEIVDNATLEANQVRESAIQYTDDMLANVENILRHSLETSAAKYESLSNSLSDCYNIVIANRAELYPVEAMAEEDAPKESSQSAEKEKEKEKEGLDII